MTSIRASIYKIRKFVFKLELLDPKSLVFSIQHLQKVEKCKKIQFLKRIPFVKNKKMDPKKGGL